MKRMAIHRRAIEVGKRGLSVLYRREVRSDDRQNPFPFPAIEMIDLFRRLIAVFIFTSATVHASSMSPDPTGYWYNPNESGWGVAIAQQNDVLFVTLLVYDEQKRPAWFVAPAVRDAGNGVFSGPLYRTSGPSFGGSFNPADVGTQVVGALAVRYAVVAVGQASMRLDYTVNGVAVGKTMLRLTWESNAPRLPGAYFGGTSLALSPVPQLNGCVPDVPMIFPPGSGITIDMVAPSTIRIIRGEGIDTVSMIAGEYLQSGQLGVIDGGVFRGPVPSPFRMGDALISNLVVTADGFVGHIQVTKDLCVYEGTIGAIRRP